MLNLHVKHANKQLSFIKNTLKDKTMKKNNHICSVKLDDNLKKDLEKAVKKSGKTKSQIIRESLKEYLANIKDLSIIEDKSKNKKRW